MGCSSNGSERTWVATTDQEKNYDVIIVGGGLAGGLLAASLFARKPNLKTLLVEAGPTLGGKHTWCFHETDVHPQSFVWLKFLISKEWPRHRLYFPDRSTHLKTKKYFAIRSEEFHHKLMDQLKDRVRLNQKAEILSANSIQLADQRRLTAGLVIDARGLGWDLNQNRVGWQKFVGLNVKLKQPHGLDAVTLMDARVDQLDGYRFLYCLPWTNTELLIEDTVYSESPHVDRKMFRERILTYASRNGWQISEVLDEEVGCLPIPLDSTWKTSRPRTPAPQIGLSSGLFHMTTGYSLPDAVRIVERISSLDIINESSVNATIDSYKKQVRHRERFYRLLNRMMFRAAVPGLRFKVMQNFYRLPDALIERFYAGQTTWRDVLRIFWNEPPVPITQALLSLYPADLVTQKKIGSSDVRI